jgi:tetratricopeptide (TPR) repeat protein
MMTRGVEGVETRLIGRDAELAQLQNAFTHSATERQTHALTIVGDAGLGKSRLMQEFLAWAEFASVSYRLFRGRATPGTMTAPYALLRDVFAFRFEIHESDPLPLARKKLEDGLMALVPNDAHAQEKAHFIGQLLGWDFSASPYIRGLLADPIQMRSLALNFLTLFFSAVAAERPVVLVLDDLHWADVSSLDALRHLLANLPPNTPLLVVGNTRATLFERYSHWSLAAQTRIDLQPLTAQDSEALVTDILRHVPTLPTSLRDLIVRQAEGNPFYVEELIKMLIDERVIQPQEPAWQVALERLSTLRVPSTLVGVLQARLDGLPATERLALQQAAVMGRVFWDTAVQAIDPAEPALPILHHRLEAAQGRELLFRRSPPAFAETQEYMFKHALLRDVAYDTVLKRDRPQYHARAAHWLEAVSGARRGEYLALLAEHYEQAGQLPQAAAMWSEAGEHALRVSAFADGVKFYKHALALVIGPSSWWRALGEAHYRLSEFPAAREALQHALDVATSESERATALALLSEMSSEIGDYAGAQLLLREALPLARVSGDQLTLCRVLYVLGDVSWRQSQLDTARAALNESLALARTLGEVTRELFALNRLGAVELYQQNPVAAEALYREVQTRALAVGNRERAMNALNNLGEVAKARHDYATAHPYHLQALQVARELGAQQFIAIYLINLSDDAIVLGKFAEAHETLREGLALARKLGAMPYVMGAVACYGTLTHAEGQTERALALWGLAQRHPAWGSENERVMEETLGRWGLAPEVIQSGLAQGAALDWDTTLNELLQT